MAVKTRFPKPLEQLLEGFALHPITTGKSGANVWRATRDNEAWFVKAQTSADEMRLEAQRFVWLQAHDIPVPEVIAYASDDTQEFLVTRALPGVDASEAPDARVAVIAIAEVLRKLHALEPWDFPFDRRLEFSIPEARQKMLDGLVDDTDFEPQRLGRTAQDLFAELLETRPKAEDLVITHGDACLPNFIVDGARVTGLIDLGRAGIADRYQDIALTLRSLSSPHNPRFHRLGDLFLEVYGLRELDSAKLEFYQLLDEFF
jgi:aminoglycoside 3'-phosphotransferase II